MSAPRLLLLLSLTEWSVRPSSLTRSGLAIALLATGFTSAGCHRSRLFSPLNGRPGIEQHANQGPSDIFISGEDAAPETLLEEVPQRLATAKTPITRKNSSSTTAATPSSTTPPSTTSAPAQTTTSGSESDDLSSRDSAAITRQVSYVSDSPSSPDEKGTPEPASSPDTYAGVDVSMVMNALKDHPPEVQREAIRRLVAMSYKKAQPTQQPAGIDNLLAASLDSLPDLPDEVVDRGLTPQRIAAKNFPPSPSKESSTSPVAHVAQTTPPLSEFNLTDQVLEDVFEGDSLSDQGKVAAATAGGENNPLPAGSPSTESDVPAVWNFSDKVADDTGASHSLSDQTNAIANQDGLPTNVQQVSATQSPDSQTPVIQPAASVAQAVNVESLSDSELYDALLKRLEQTEPNESDAQKQRRQIIKRHLMVLSGDPDQAVDKLEGLTTQEQEYLRHQLLGLWTIIDPNGHPVPSRRFSSALPQIRQATEFLAAASDSLDVRALEFCTEIEAYGQIKPFPKRQFDPGQQVILYCEIENFVAKKISQGSNQGFETMLQGSYDLLDESGRRVASQSLPVDKQLSQNKLRDYFIAYQMYLPDSLEPGRYRLRLTMEDVHGKKYGQNEVTFEIKR
ncbi:hypothetical protein [Rhodopirellula sp. P2]|uniref:hypothetical protein n=1 Tax=Rhodopirellula sp. P2 TaxID=2127060 RepID=UPI002368546A|nr:hypothetical protein [Rhodopirellula sp. P2]WDQ16700.1 hypothetical protein PSR62_24240 [Rhodopirellula sp. P2]